MSRTGPESAETDLAVLDLEHLDRQTMGDRALAAEVLGLFVSQSRAFLERLTQEPDAAERSRLFHTLAGSARGIGAWRAAAYASSCESEATANLDLTPLRQLLANVEAAAVAFAAGS